MAAVDPFTRAYQAILAALKAWPGFTAIVRAGNIIDMTSPQLTQAIKPQAQDADTPEAALLQDAFILKPFGVNSRDMQFEQSYTLMITAQNLNIVLVNNLKYQTLIALLKAGPTLGLDGLVRKFEITDGHDSSTSKSQSRNTSRWVTALKINVEMYLDKAQMTAQTTTP